VTVPAGKTINPDKQKAILSPEELKKITGSVENEAKMTLTPHEEQAIKLNMRTQ